MPAIENTARLQGRAADEQELKKTKHKGRMILPPLAGKDCRRSGAEKDQIQKQDDLTAACRKCQQAIRN